MGKGAGGRGGGQSPSPLEKLRVAKQIYTPLFFALNLRKKLFFTLVWKHIYCPLSKAKGYKDIWIRYAFKP